MRFEYESRGLSEDDVAADPVEQFRVWMQEAIDADLVEPNATVLSTVDESGSPTARHVLLKGVSADGFDFYTNYRSDKARHLAARPVACLTFPWLALHRQVRIEGTVTKLDGPLSDAYFELRPRATQIGAWASDQSEVIASRTALEERFAEFERRFPDAVDRPPHWGGYRLRPSVVEFWQGRPSRLHDRIRYRLDDDRWIIERLAP